MTAADWSDTIPTGSANALLEFSALPIDMSKLPPAGSLQAILDGHVKLSHLPGLVNVDYCNSVIDALADVSYSEYQLQDVATTAPLLKVGPTAHWQFEHDGGLERYFSEAESVDEQLRDLFRTAGIDDPLDILIRLLRHMWHGPVDLATEGEKRYFSGVVRSVTGGADPHTDNAQRTPQLSIGKVLSQGSILIYLRMPPAGGGMRVFHKRPASPVPLDGRGWEGVAGLAFSGVTPSAGDVVVFPTTHVHAVEPVIGEGERITISTFFGALPDGRLTVWS